MTQQSVETYDHHPARYVWHPVIEVALWFAYWLMFALATSIVWEFLTNHILHPGTVIARGLTIFVALGLLTFVVFMVDAAGSVAQYAWDQYEPQFTKRIYAAVFMVFVLILIPYLFFMAWLLNLIWKPLVEWCATSKLDLSETVAITPSWLTWIVLSSISFAIACFVVDSIWRNPFFSYRGALRILGLRRILYGVLLMAYLRLLVPRRDLFLQGTIVSWMLPYAFLVLLHNWIPIGLFACLIPILLLAILVPMQLDLIAPPQWLFLGASELESFQSFYKLRMRWRRHGLTLLDRASAGGLMFYYGWRSRLAQDWIRMDPTIPRVWSLRTRPGVWPTAVRLLAAFVPVVIVDRRFPSEIVDIEVKWLGTRGHWDKTYFLVSPEVAQLSNKMGTLCQQTDEATLLSASWRDTGLTIIK